MRNGHRNNRIDFLRGVAIFAVLLLHFHISYPLDQSALSSIFSTTFIKAVASNGNYGVTIFFVISGFLITSTALERYGSLARVDLVGFYIFRFARIMPCLLLVLSLIALFGFLHIQLFQNKPDSTSLFMGIFSVLTFWHNVLMERVGYFNYCLNIFWSLSVEEVFYLVFPVLCLTLKKRKAIFLFLSALIIMAPLVRNHNKSNEIVALYGYFSCFDAIAMGCIAAMVSQKVQLKHRLRKTLLYGAGLLIAMVYLYSGIMENVVMGISLLAVGVAIFLISASNNEINENNEMRVWARIFCWFGQNSYELYLFHIVVLALMKGMVSPGALGNYTKLVWMTVFFAASVIVAGAISRFYSQPLNGKLRKFLFNYRRHQFLSPALLKSKGVKS